MFKSLNDKEYKAYAREHYEKANRLALSNKSQDESIDASVGYHTSLSALAERMKRIPTPAEKRRAYEEYFIDKKVVYNDKLRTLAYSKDAYDLHLHKKVELTPRQRHPTRIPEEERFSIFKLFNK